MRDAGRRARRRRCAPRACRRWRRCARPSCPRAARRGRIFTAVAALLDAGRHRHDAAYGLFGADRRREHGGRPRRRRRRGDAASACRCSARGWCAPLASVIGWPLERLRGLTGRLARENAVRKPGRTAVTAGGADDRAGGRGVRDRLRRRASARRSATRSTATSRATSSSRTPTASRRSARARAARRSRSPGVKTVSSLSFAGGVYKRQGHPRVGGRSRRPCRDVLSLDWKKGSPSTLSSLSGDGAVLDDAWAKNNDIDVGDRLTVRTALERAADADRRGHRQGQRRPARQPGRHRRAAAPRVRRARAEHDVRQARARAPTPRGCRTRSRTGVKAKFADRRGAQPEGAEGQPGAADPAAGRVLLRAAGAGDRDLAARAS